MTVAKMLLTLDLDSVVGPLCLQWVMGVHVSSCELPGALLVE